MLEEAFISIASVRSVDELTAQFAAFTRQLEFHTFTASAIRDECDGHRGLAWVDNVPAAYRALPNYVDGGRVDPVLQHCKRSSLPIAWSQATYVAAGKGAKWEQQASHGFRSGITVALHLRHGLHFLVGVDRDGPLPRAPKVVTRMVARLHLFTICAHEAALKHLLHEMSAADRPDLTPRELECLRWTLEGKTAWEVGQILSISEQTAARHLCNAMRKLDCVNKHHAAVKALRLGLIS